MGRQMRDTRPRLALMACCAGAVALLAGCVDNKDWERLNDRGDLIAAIDAGAQRPQADLTGLSGTASYAGAAAASFPGAGEDEVYNARADLAMTVDFSAETLSGTMSRWASSNPEDWAMDGTVFIADGQIDRDGSFDAKLSGNVRREPTAQHIVRAQEDDDVPMPQGIIYTFIRGTAEGTFHDSAQGRGTHIIGTLQAEGVSGFFAAERDR